MKGRVRKKSKGNETNGLDHQECLKESFAIVIIKGKERNERRKKYE